MLNVLELLKITISSRKFTGIGKESIVTNIHNQTILKTTNNEFVIIAQNDSGLWSTCYINNYPFVKEFLFYSP